MKLKAYKNKFFMQVPYGDRSIPQKAGFTWNKGHKCWATDDPIKAYPFIEYADWESGIELYNAYSTIQESIEASKAETSDFDAPAPEGLVYMPFQKAGIEFMSGRTSTLLADDMGLGKTIQAIGFMNFQKTDLSSILIICPASLKLMWAKEVLKWSTFLHLDPQIVSNDAGVLPNCVNIINYDILKKHRKRLKAVEWDLIILDECHYIKNKKAQRTKEITGFRNMKPLTAKYKIALTGTPVTNGKPKEMWPILNWLDPDTWPNWWEYVHRYCGAYRGTWGLDVEGATNLKEFQQKLRSTVMIRRLKKDVLPELPDKIREVIEIPESGKIVRQEQKRLKQYKEDVNDLKILTAIEFAEIAEIRHDTALLKVPFVIEHLKAVVGTGQKVICFAWHQDVVSSILEGVGAASAVTLTGKTSMEDRDAAVDRFQNDPECKYFIGNIQAAGTGITLTAAYHVVFAELSWVPGEVTQAEDRPNRIGQKNAVIVQHLVLEGSIDAIIAKRLVAKQELNDKALDIGSEAKIIREAL